jgi:hypothetical protein
VGDDVQINTSMQRNAAKRAIRGPLEYVQTIAQAPKIAIEDSAAFNLPSILPVTKGDTPQSQSETVNDIYLNFRVIEFVSERRRSEHEAVGVN